MYVLGYMGAGQLGLATDFHTSLSSFFFQVPVDLFVSYLLFFLREKYFSSFH